MASFSRHRNGIYYIVLLKDGKRIWRSLQTRDKKAAYMLFLKKGHDEGHDSTRSLSAVNESIPSGPANSPRGSG